MSAVLPPVACRCGRTMRPCEARDVYECRCGLWLAGEAVFAGLPITNDAFQQGEPYPDPPAGLRVSDTYGDLALGWEAIDIDPARGPAPLEWQRMCADAFEGSGLRYQGKPKHAARVLMLESGEELKRHAVYALVPLGQEREAVAAVVRFIRDKHGAGKLWAHGDVSIGPLRKRDQAGWRGAELSSVQHVLLGCYYFHKPIN